MALPPFDWDVLLTTRLRSYPDYQAMREQHQRDLDEFLTWKKKVKEATKNG